MLERIPLRVLVPVAMITALAYSGLRWGLTYSSMALAAYSALELENLRQRHRAHLPALLCRKALFMPSWLFYHSRRLSWVG
jgi:hypothetical protein